MDPSAAKYHPRPNKLVICAEPFERGPLTLKRPPSQNDIPSVSFIAQAKLAALRPDSVRQRDSSAALRSPNEEPFCHGPFPIANREMKNHWKRRSKLACTSPFARRVFQSSASLTLLSQAASNELLSVPHCRGSSSFHKSVACKVRWYPKVCMRVSYACHFRIKLLTEPLWALSTSR